MKIIIPKDTKINKKKISNEIGTIITYKGKKPEYAAAPPTNKCLDSNDLIASETDLALNLMNTIPIIDTSSSWSGDGGSFSGAGASSDF